MLELSNIPLRASDKNDSHPLLILGGVCAFFNPEPLADFFDMLYWRGRGNVAGVS